MFASFGVRGQKEANDGLNFYCCKFYCTFFVSLYELIKGGGGLEGGLEGGWRGSNGLLCSNVKFQLRI